MSPEQARASGEAPWWLEGGTEHCDFCHGRFWHEVEVRCVECDRAGCPHCMVVVRRGAESRCPECHGVHTGGAQGDP